METEKVVFMYLGTHTYTHMYVTIINEKSLEFEKEKGEAYTGQFEGQQTRKEML